MNSVNLEIKLHFVSTKIFNSESNLCLFKYVEENNEEEESKYSVKEYVVTLSLVN